jgi:hypothetical protein
MKGVYCLHGSAVSIGGKGVLLMGSVSGLGKTSLAVSLCLLGHAKFIGDEKILINQNGEIISGLKNLTFNKEVLNKFLPSELNGLTSDELGRIIRLEEENIPLHLVVTPILFNDSLKLETDKWDSAKASFHFYEELSRKIRGISRRVNHYTTTVASVDDQVVADSRSSFCTDITSKIDFWLMKGSQESVVKKILSIIKTYA